ncbi:hypothetical protein [Novipirellula caenicola]|uniref:Nickel uptake substrate-specific transmembrane region n=1 Tax=Novipirellula caenicola TaxID=1536901 RepID=A0ABP9VIL1_9BACT
MRFPVRLISISILLLAIPADAFADGRNRISIRVVDAQGDPVADASVVARYQQIVHQNGKEFRVPMELAAPQTTDADGRCELSLYDVAWTLAGVHALRAELKTEEIMEMVDDAPADPLAREQFLQALYERGRRFRSAYHLLTAKAKDEPQITLQMEKAIKVTGRVLVNGKPLAKAFVTISSKPTSMDQLFSRWAPELTDDEGKFAYYSVPGDLDRARIVVERPKGNRSLMLEDVRSKTTSDGLHFELDTRAKDYTQGDKL